MIPLEHFLILGAILFCIGIAIVLTKKSLIMVLMGLELILNAVNINFVAFSKYHGNNGGQMFALFVMIIAASELALGLAILMNIYKNYKQTDADKLNELGG